MDVTELGEQRASDGQEFILAIERLGIDVSAALWMFSPITNEWRLMIVSDDLDEKGPKFLIGKTREWIRRKNGRLSFELYDVEFESKTNPGAISLASQIDADGTNSIRLAQANLNGIVYPDMLIYRVRRSAILRDDSIDRPRLGGRGGR
jgi:hypothetical protein